jgi:hypothetical protein
MRRKQIGLKASNVVLSILVVGMFMYLLVLAMAQDQVLEKLSRSSEFNNYSASLLDARKAKETDDEIGRLVKDRLKLKADLALAETKVAGAQLRFRGVAGSLEPIFTALESAPDCRITRKPIVAAETKPTAAARGKPIAAAVGPTPQETEIQVQQAQLAAAQQCFDLYAELRGKQRERYRATLDTAKSLADDAVRAGQERVEKLQARKTQQEDINRNIADRDKLTPTQIHFAVLNSLEFDWLPINLVGFPPFIIRVLLSFFSGTFGALLITMVFVVYPSKLRERVSPKLYYKRVFLGGLVALTVFIVLTGGASILGTSEVSTDDANVMSFTAIGLLAGMFSDTVADWLSVRAKSMFSVEEDEDESKDKDDGKGKDKDKAKDGNRAGAEEAGPARA